MSLSPSVPREQIEEGSGQADESQSCDTPSTLDDGSVQIAQTARLAPMLDDTLALASPIASSGMAVIKSLYAKAAPNQQQLERAPESSATALLVCEVFGGNVPADVAAAGSASVKVSIGTSSGVRQCYEACYGESNFSEGVQVVIGRLAESGWDAHRISAVVDGDAKMERLQAIGRIMRKRLGWNLELLQRICVPVQASDITQAETITVEILAKGKTIATGSIKLENVLGSSNVRCRQVVYCSGTERDQKAHVDVEFRMFALVKRGSEYIGSKANEFYSPYLSL